MADEAEEVGATATRRSSLSDALKPDQVVDEFGEDVDVSEGALADKYGGDNEVGEVGPQKKWVKFSYEPSLKTMAEELTEALEDYGFKVFVEENYPLSHTSPWRGTRVCGVPAWHRNQVCILTIMEQFGLVESKAPLLSSH
jgi:hypothetical protein